MFQYFCVNSVIKLIKIYNISTRVRCRAVSTQTSPRISQYPLPFRHTVARTTPPVRSPIPTAIDSTLHLVHVFTAFVFLKLLFRFFPILLCSGKLKLYEHFFIFKSYLQNNLSTPFSISKKPEIKIRHI
jgi:hypothetical protein